MSTIYVIEDHKARRDKLYAFLERNGYHTKTVTDFCDVAA